MTSNNTKINILIGTSLLVAMILTILPLPKSVAWWRPEWVYMVLFFWWMRAPHRVGVIFAFAIGLIVDLLTGTIFGLHALLFSLTAFFVLYFEVKIHGLPIWQRMLLFFMILLVGFAIQSWVFSLIDLPTYFWHTILTAAISALLWPWVYLLLRDFQQRYEIR